MERKDKASLKLTGKRYNSVEDLMQGEGISKEVRNEFASIEQATQISSKLAQMRTASGLTQAEMAKKIGCTQGCISKWESEEDHQLTIKVISEYCRVLNQRVGIHFGKPLSHVEAVKGHAFGLRDALSNLAALAKDDREIEQGIQAFFSEAFFNFLTIFASTQQELPNGRAFEIRMEVEAQAGKSSNPTEAFAAPC